MRKTLWTVGTSIILAVIFGFCWLIYDRAEWEKELKKVATECYEKEADVRTFVRNQNVIATYESSEEVIIITVRNEKGMSYVKTDFNKSRIVGEYLGKKIKQGIAGFKEGMTEESKFER